MDVKILYHQYTEVTQPRDPDDEWSMDDLSHHLVIEGIKIDQYGDVQTTFDIERDRPYWLLIVRYSTGDSFHTEKGCHSFVGLFQTPNEAEYAAKIIEEDGGNQNNHAVFIPGDNGAPYMLSTSMWNGYFDSLEGTNIVEVYLSYTTT